MIYADRLATSKGRGGGALGGMVMVLFVIGVMMVSVGYALRDLPIRSVRIAGTLQHIDRTALERLINARLDGGFFDVDVDGVRKAVEQLPWVRDASVRRVWPDSLHVAVVERTAAARWGRDQLIESDGTVFSPNGGGSRGLARLEGPPGSAHRVLARYRLLQRLLAPLEGHLEHLVLNARGTWRGRLDTGMTMVFEEGLKETRLRQFVEVASKVLGPRLGEVMQVDLRYVNGFAVRWKAQRQQVNG